MDNKGNGYLLLRIYQTDGQREVTMYCTSVSITRRWRNLSLTWNLEMKRETDVHKNSGLYIEIALK